VNDTITIVDFAQIASGVAASVALLLNWLAIRGQTKATTISTLNAFLDRSEKYEKSLHDAIGQQNFVRHYTDYLNHLEILATCINKRLYPKVARSVARNRLIEDLAILQTTPGAPDLMSGQIDAPNTFGDIRLFIRSNKVAMKEACARRTPKSP
jgi:hypothetical protein